MPSPKRDPAENRITVRDIAKATGVHFTTVSLALRDSPLLKLETREKIRKAAEDLGYRPDPMLTALNAYRNGKRTPHFQSVIGWINNWPDRAALQKVPSFAEYYRGVTDRTHELGYLVEEFWLHEKGMNAQKLRRILKARNIQALLLAPQPKPQTNPNIDYSDFSVLCFGYTLQPSDLHVITNHHYHSMRLMISKLLELGYRRMGLCVSDEWDEKVENGWLGGLMLARAKHPEIVPIPPFHSEWGHRAEMKKWIKEQKPDVIISCNMAFGEIRELGYKIPEEIGFASLDVGPYSPGMSGVNENDFLIGRKAVDLLVDMIHRGERGVPEVPIRTLVESVWVPGTTLRPQPQKTSSRKSVLQK